MGIPFLIRHIALALFCLLPFSPGYASDLDQQREAYERATQALAQGDSRTFRTLTRELEDYPLYPYLLYADYSVSLHRTPRHDIEHFLSRYDGTVLASRLRGRWLKRLQQTGDLKTFVREYDPAVATTELACHYQYARYQLGDQESAIAEALKLWQVGKSQPKECDPLFHVLIKNGHITNEVAWRRYTEAVLNHEYTLARYLERFFTQPRYRELARKFVNLDRNPANLSQYDQFREYTPDVLAVITHAISHLANRNAPLALRHWNHYHQRHDFPAELQARVIDALVRALHSQQQAGAADELLAGALTQNPENLLDWRLREALKTRDWGVILRLSEQLARHHPLSERWQYWRARALQEVNGKDDAEATTLLRQVSDARSFYGFTASEALGQPYNYQHKPVAVADGALERLAATPAFQRIRELLHHEDWVAARREWYHVLSDASPDQWITAAKLAQHWQWHQLAILSMVRAGYWDDIDVRFPLAWVDEFRRNADKTGLPLALLIAVSRQESALAPDVISPVGARGLMQLMPATARHTAGKYGIGYRGESDLAEPHINIALGSRYYKEMLERYGNNRILATAAYNAGPGRVDRWLKSSQGTLPFDAWIETIPFNETRQYVQNVLAFAVIYGHHLATNVALVDNGERKRLL